MSPSQINSQSWCPNSFCQFQYNYNKSTSSFRLVCLCSGPEPAVLHGSLRRLSHASVGVPLRERFRGSDPRLCLHPHAGRRVRQPTRVAVPTSHLVLAARPVLGPGETLGRARELHPEPIVETFPATEEGRPLGRVRLPEVRRARYAPKRNVHQGRRVVREDRGGRVLADNAVTRRYKWM